MSEVSLRALVTQVFSRNPGLVFDALPPLDSTTPRNDALPWCTCGNCREMATDAERKCCGQGPDYCISKLPHFDLYCLEDGYLRIHRDYRNDVLVVAEVREPGDNRQFRYTAYRQYIFWQHGSLGQGNRRVIPSCCMENKGQIPRPPGPVHWLCTHHLISLYHEQYTSSYLLLYICFYICFLILYFFIFVCKEPSSFFQ